MASQLTLIFLLKSVDVCDITIQGMIKYWEMRGKEEDVWISCDSPEERLTVYFKIGDRIFSP